MSGPEKSHDKPCETSETTGDNSDQDSARRLVRHAEPFLGLEASAEASADERATPAEPFRFAELSQKVRLAAGTGSANEVELQVQLGQTQLGAEELQELEPGTLLTLNELATEPVEILAAGHVIARAEVVMLGEEPAVRIVEVL